MTSKARLVLVEEMVNPPGLDVIKLALLMVIQSTHIMNQAHLLKMAQTPQPHQTADGRLSELIKVACQALVREADIQSGVLRHKHDTSAAEFRRQRDSKAAALAYRQNSLVPISNLPVELFSNIIILASLEGWGHLSHIDVVGTLVMVSKHWSDVVFATPQLWSTLEEVMSQKQLVLSIERSKGLSLNIHFHRIVMPSFEQLHRESFISTIVPHMHRWRSIDGHEIPWQVIEGLESNASLLQHIQMEQAEWHNHMPTVLGDGIQLRHLHLTNIGIIPNPNRLRGLFHLSLENLRGIQGLSVVFLTLALSLSPELQVLSLIGVDVILNPGDGDLDTEPFPPFHSLKRLQLRHISSRAYANLLTRLRFPNCESIDLEPDPSTASVDGDHHIPFRHDAPHFIQQVRGMLIYDESPIQVTLGQAHSSNVISVRSVSTKDTKNVGFNLRLRAALVQPGEMWSSDAVEQVIELVQQSYPAGSSLHLAVNLSRDRPQYPLDCVGRFGFAYVEKIAITGYSDLYAILDLLTRRQDSSSDEAALWLYPGLKTIDLFELSGSNSMTAIREAVKDRWMLYKDSGSGSVPEGLVEVTMPRRKGGKKEIWKRMIAKDKSKKFYDLEGQIAEEKLDPPEADVFKRALVTPIESRKAANQAHLSNLKAAASPDCRWADNPLVPINKLPFKLFSNIIILASLEGRKTLPRIDVVGSLTMVSKHWSDMVFSTPQLRSTLEEETMSLKQSRLSMARSKRSPAHLIS
ncbi:hypothetical protein FRB97_000224 [Tulasnella sp. 331]|nr:hypothetical protein FRB97_000224 [Tulasnella sp. 331]